MADQGTLEILIDIRSKLEQLTRTSDESKNLTEDLKNLRQEGGQLANMFKTGLGIDIARRSLDLLSGSVRQFIGEAFRMAGRIKDQAESLRISREAYQVLGYEITEAGGNVEQLSVAVATNNRSLVEARSGAGAAASAYRNLGLSVAALEELPVEQRFAAIARAIANAKDQARAFSDAGVLLGTRNLPILLAALKNLGAQGYDEVAAAAKRAGMVMSDEAIERLDAAAKSIERLKKSATIATGESIGVLLGDDNESAELLVKWIKAGAQGFRDFGEGIGYAAAAIAINRQALDEYGAALADVNAEAEASPLPDVTDPNGNRLNQLYGQQIFNQSALASLQNKTLMAEAKKRASIALALEYEIELLQEIAEIKAADYEVADPENLTDEDLQKLREYFKLLGEIDARRSQLAALQETPVQRSVRVASGINDPAQNANFLSVGDGFTAGAADYITELGSTGERVAQNLRANLGGAVSDISDGIYGWVSGAQSAGEAVLNFVGSILDRMLQTIIEMGVQWLVQQALIQTGIVTIKATTSAVRAADVAETNAAEAAKAPALATNAGLASISSFGIAPVLGVAALVAAIAVIGSLAFREKGGPVEAGRAYVVGEKRPEIFVPTTAGTIIPSLDAFSVPTAAVASSVAGAPSLGVSSGTGAGVGGAGSTRVSIATVNTRSEFRRFLETAEGRQIIQDATARQI